MEMIRIIQVQSAELVARWELVEPWIAKALPVASKRFQPIDVLCYCLQNIAQGWFIVDDTEIVAIVITKIDQYPRQRCLSIFVVSGIEHRMMDWFPEAENVLTEYAIRMGCTQFECQGRKGWEKVLNLEPRSTVFVKEINNGGAMA